MTAAHVPSALLAAEWVERLRYLVVAHMEVAW